LRGHIRAFQCAHADASTLLASKVLTVGEAANRLFVELAARKRLPLATFDRALLKAFPGIARRPAALLAK
jgi:hypothetical protein